MVIEPFIFELLVELLVGVAQITNDSAQKRALAGRHITNDAHKLTAADRNAHVLEGEEFIEGLFLCKQSLAFFHVLLLARFLGSIQLLFSDRAPMKVRAIPYLDCVACEPLVNLPFDGRIDFLYKDKVLNSGHRYLEFDHLTNKLRQRSERLFD